MTWRVDWKVEFVGVMNLGKQENTEKKIIPTLPTAISPLVTRRLKLGIPVETDERSNRSNAVMAVSCAYGLEFLIVNRLSWATNCNNCYEFLKITKWVPNEFLEPFVLSSINFIFNRGQYKASSIEAFGGRRVIGISGSLIWSKTLM